MKRRIPAIALVLALLVIATSAYVTLAYFTADDQVTNVITAGNVKIQLCEMMATDNGDTLVPFENVSGVMPGTEVSKIVTVKNTGNNAAYVRVSVESLIKDASGIEDELLTGELDSYIEIDIDSTNWTYMDDGYYYYNTALEAGAETEPLFTIVKYSEKMPNEYQNTTLEMNITAYATQKANNGANVFEASGWPA